jgi:hypothetical protein
VQSRKQYFASLTPEKQAAIDAALRALFDAFIDEWNRNGAEPAPLPVKPVESKARLKTAKVKR